MNSHIIQKSIKKPAVIAFLLLASSLAFSQEKLPITTKIVDSQNLPVAYASISFSNSESITNSDAALSDEEGNITLSLMPGKYTITIEAFDFKKAVFTRTIEKPGEIENFKIEFAKSENLTPTQNIEGVVIQAQSTKPYRVELDKKVYDPSSDLISKGGNLQDVLANVPSIAVDTDGTVSMRGNSNIRFLINGKPSALLGIDSGADALRSIPADQIDRIEVITNPSSKFEASGSAGILNIILKKTKGRGFNGTVTGNLGYLPQTSLNANLSWKVNNWNYFVNGGGGYNERESKNTNDAKYFDSNNSITGYTEQDSKNTNKNDSYNVNTGFNVDITDKTSINASGLLRTFESESFSNVNYKTLDASKNLLDNSRRYTVGNGDNFTWQVDAGLDHKFDDKGQILTASISLQQSDNKNNSLVEESSNNIFILNNNINQNTINKTLVGKVDYELPIGEKSKVEAGYRIDQNTNDYDYKVTESFDQVNFNVLNDFTSKTIYKERTQAAYAQFKSKTGKVGYQLGLRAENSNITVDFNNLSGTNSDIKKNYTGLFPSVFLSYDVGENDDNQLLLNYSRRINRPRSYFLIPFSSFSDNRNQFFGNPDLNPEYTNSFELGYAIQKKKFTINPTLYYKRTVGETQFVVTRENLTSDNFVTRPYNIGAETQYGLDLNFTADILPWYKVLGSMELFGYKVEGMFDDPALVSTPIDFSGDGFSSRLRLTNTFKIDKTFNMQLQGFYSGGEKTAFQDRKGLYTINFGASKTVLNGDGTITFNIQDIFNTRARTVTSFGDGFERESYNQWNPRQVSLGFSYRFKQGEKVTQKKAKRDINNNGGGDEEPPM
ncbi:TonB-dependent receptor domain-containing protein [Frigoriflavimonas asaccharolytica]|uniref:Outer membrane receptor protein involved in Fe transport n=1 Tax=Frigoriflavimonas asaccharolytica TaxID=2735899 RepID=A0A8J8K761_9FLAO|nr:TonB-dependent receptor [Frigoriflavimonas asaccharolytica]NRS91668.1 outer membrane receptor protein involved in Fe transport [Frigoriflavimonas asaccharolytica]